MGTHSEHDDPTSWIAKAVEQFDRHEKRRDGARVVGCLIGGLTVLRESLYLRVHQDVEQAMGVDSMLMPVSELRALQRTSEEIEAFQVAESAATVGQFGYVAEAETWYLPWLARLRGGQPGQEATMLPQIRAYFSASADQRRLDFADVLARVIPESRRAPLVLFRLVPLAVQIATALAFGDHATASRLREQQLALLPAIADCQQCRGQVLESDESCRACGNPLWKYDWLVSLD